MMPDDFHTGGIVPHGERGRVHCDCAISQRAVDAMSPPKHTGPPVTITIQLGSRVLGSVATDRPPRRVHPFPFSRPSRDA